MLGMRDSPARSQLNYQMIDRDPLLPSLSTQRRIADMEHLPFYSTHPLLLDIVSYAKT